MAMTQSSTRSRILEQGTDLLSASGLAGVTLGVLAEQIGMSKSGLFAHFRSKQDLDLALLEHTAEIAGKHVVGPAMKAPEGLPRLKALVHNWLGWTARAGLSGGCPVAAGIFELDDSAGPVRDRLQELEAHWRGVLGLHIQHAVVLGHLRPDTDVDQFVWELCGIYFSHHASLRFVRDPKANQFAYAALEALFARWTPVVVQKRERSKPEKAMANARPRPDRSTRPNRRN